MPATEIGAVAVREAVRRAGVDPGAVEEVILGNALQGGEGQGPARQAAMGGGIPSSVPAVTINKVCGSGLKAVMLASQAILGLGAMGDPKSGRVVVDLPGARFSIDLLTMLEQRTKGNLTDEEVKELSQILAELRGRFVQISQLVAQQPAVAPEAAATPTAGGRLQPPPPSPS